MKVKASKASLARRKPLFGVGINDADYIVRRKTKRGYIRCPYYSVWAGMLKRCYSPSSLKSQPTYALCTVCDEWLTFSTFRAWMEKQAWKGMQLDKDILVPGNTVYGPDTCVFVSGLVNHIMMDNQSRRGVYPQGVSLKPGCSTFLAKYRKEGKQVAIGSFPTVEEAEVAYMDAKRKEIIRVAMLQDNIRVREAMILYANSRYNYADQD